MGSINYYVARGTEWLITINYRVTITPVLVQCTGMQSMVVSCKTAVEIHGRIYGGFRVQTPSPK